MEKNKYKKVVDEIKTLEKGKKKTITCPDNYAAKALRVALYRLVDTTHLILKVKDNILTVEWVDMDYKIS